ncbi:glycosyltransferase family 4 protein [Flavobacteriaceae bacterium]|nr:glycosyltransferase family 4 protein [Flavobacteriaceae bacterium]
MKVLWVSPNLNHYKASFLEKLNVNTNIELTVLSGSGRQMKGDNYFFSEKCFQLNSVGVSKSKFGFSKKVRAELKKNFFMYDWIMIPREKKNLALFLYAMLLKKKAFKKGHITRLISYNHPMVTSNHGQTTIIDKIITKFYYRLYDRIIFYTEKSCLEMVAMGYIKKEKAFWANNTINSDEIENNYTFSYPNESQPTILFIGRLIAKKKLTTLVNYYRLLKIKNKNLKLVVIGDGPERNIIQEAMCEDNSIQWTGALIEEKDIAPYMSKASIVFVPGHSGLSVNHAFLYGRPYFTIVSKTHAPEIDYLKNGINGYILGNNDEENINFISIFLKTVNQKIYDNAYNTGKELSVTSWCNKIEEAIINK